jgi:LysM repeat protein
MRMIVIEKASDLKALQAQLLANADDKEATLQQLQRLNPHVDFQRIEPGTVLLVPDRPGIAKDATTPVTADAADEFSKQVGAALDAADTRVRQGYQTLAAQRQEVTAVIKTAAVKRLLESDPDLSRQLDAAAKVFKDDQQRAKDAEATLKTLREGGKAELDTLAKLLT